MKKLYYDFLLFTIKYLRKMSFFLEKKVPNRKKTNPKKMFFYNYLRLGDEFREKIWDEISVQMKSIKGSLTEEDSYIIVNGLLLRIYSFLRHFVISASNLYPKFGQIIFRSQLESYFYLKYILHDKKRTSELSKTFREYGLGEEKKIKLQYQKYIQEGVIESNPQLIEYIESSGIGEKRDAMIDVSFKVFENMNQICTEIGEKFLYDTKYTIGSQYSHGSYNRLKSNHLEFCKNPLHKYHLLPSMGKVFNDGESMDIGILIDSLEVFEKSYEIRCNHYGLENNISEIIDEYTSKFISLSDQVVK